MNNKTKLMAAGGIIAILFIVVVYLNFFNAPAPATISPEADTVIKAQMEHNAANPTPEPDMTTVPEGARKPGGKSTGK